MPCSLEENQETLTHLQQLFGWHTKVHRQTEWRELSRCKSGGLEPSAQKWLFQKLVWKTFAAVSTSLFYFVSNYDKHNVAQKWSCLIFYFFFQLFSFFPRSVFLGVFLWYANITISTQKRKKLCFLPVKKNASQIFLPQLCNVLHNWVKNLQLFQFIVWRRLVNSSQKLFRKKKKKKMITLYCWWTIPFLFLFFFCNICISPR